jgi:hypothetical protein
MTTRALLTAVVCCSHRRRRQPNHCNGSSQNAIFKLCREKFVPEAMRSNKEVRPV